MPDPVTPAAPAAPAVTPAAPAASAPSVPPVVPPAPNTPPVTPPAAPAVGEPPPGAPANAPGQSAEVVYALTLPASSVLDPTAVERATALAQGAKLDPKAAQQVVEFASAEVGSFFEKQKTEYAQKITGWETQVKADPELGGQNFDRTTLRSKVVMDRFLAARPAQAKELEAALKSTGFGNYPALVSLFDFYGSLMESDGGVLQNPGLQDTRSAADRMFPTSAGK